MINSQCANSFLTGLNHCNKKPVSVVIVIGLINNFVLSVSPIARNIMKSIIIALFILRTIVGFAGTPGVANFPVSQHDNSIGLLTVACDVGVSHILQPDSGVNLSSSVMVAVRINNYGTQPQSQFPVSYRVDNGPVVTEQVAITIPPGGNIVYTFGATANLSSVGVNYHLMAWTGLGCDTIPQNDTAWKQAANLPAVYCVSTALQPGGAEVTHMEIGGYMHGSAAAGALYSDHTGLLPPVHLVQGGGYSLRITTSSFPGTTTLSASYLKAWIDFNRDGVFDTLSEQIISILIPSDTMIIAPFTVPAQAYPGTSRMRIVVQQTQQAGDVLPCGTYTYGKSVDYRVQLHAAVSCDAGIREVVQPNPVVEPGVPTPLIAVIRNYGTSSIQAGNLSVGYTLNGGTPQLFQYTGSNIAPGMEEQVTLPAVSFPAGNNKLCILTHLSCDIQNIFNNSLCIDVYGNVHASLPFSDGFETDNYWYRTPGQMNWELGAPAKPIINAPSGGSKAWVTRLTGNYSPFTHEHLVSPYFDFSVVPQGDTVELSFHQWCAMASGDYGTVGYSTDSGLTWMPLGQTGDPSGSNWYNHQAGQADGFSYTNSGWMTSSFKLSPSVFNGNPNVQFRFTFVSDSAGTSDGWAIDNFRLDVPTVPDDVGVVAFIYPLNDTAMGSIVSGITVAVTNYGTDVQTNVPLQLTLNGLVVSSVILSDTLYPEDTLLVTFPDPITVPAFSYTLAARTTLPSDPYAGNDSVWISFHPLAAYTDVKISFLEPGGTTPEPVMIAFHLSFYPNLCLYPVSVRIENNGQLALDTIPIHYRFHNSGMLYQYQWNGNLPVNSFVDITLPEFFKPYPGLQKVTVFMDLQGNINPANDTTSREFIGVTGCIGSIDNLVAGPVYNLRNVPNPATDRTDISFSLLSEGMVTMRLNNLAGLVLQTHTFMASQGENLFPVDLTGLANGIYIYHLEFEGRRVSGKMVIQR